MSVSYIQFTFIDLSIIILDVSVKNNILTSVKQQTNINYSIELNVERGELEELNKAYKTFLNNY